MDADSKKMKLYNPKEYFFIGFFFSLIPVLWMSFANSKILQNGVAIRKRMKIYLSIFVLLLILDLGILIWSNWLMSSSLAAAISNDPSIFSKFLNSADPRTILHDISSPTIKFAETFSKSAGSIFLILHLILLIIVTRFTKKVEVPTYQALKENNQIEVRKPWLPVLAGIIFAVLLYFGIPSLSQAMTKVFFEQALKSEDKKFKEEMVKNQPEPTLENSASAPSPKTLAEPPKKMTLEEQLLASAHKLCPQTIYAKDPDPTPEYWYGNTYFLNDECSYSRETKMTTRYIDEKGNCARDMDSELSKRTYNLVNGCLYKENESLLRKRISGMILDGEFGESYDLWPWEDQDKKHLGAGISEWFRFEEGNELFIFLLSSFDCGGCTFNGPYLVINKMTGEIQTRNSDLPNLFDSPLLLTPNKKRAIDFSYSSGGYQENPPYYGIRNVKLYLYDFLKFKRTHLVYEVPNESAVIECGHGCYAVGDSISWIDDNHVKIQLYKRQENGELAFERDEQGKIIFVPEGEPIVIDIRTLAPLPE